SRPTLYLIRFSSHSLYSSCAHCDLPSFPTRRSSDLHLIEPYEIQSDNQEMSKEEARQYTRTALDKRINTQVSYETTFVDLENVRSEEHTSELQSRFVLVCRLLLETTNISSKVISSRR